MLLFLFVSNGDPLNGPWLSMFVNGQIKGGDVNREKLQQKTKSNLIWLRHCGTFSILTCCLEAGKEHKAGQGKHCR